MPANSPHVSPTSTEAGGVGGLFEIATKDADDRRIILTAAGNEPMRWFAREAGGHRWQHIPAHDRHGRVHSSTVTVAVLNATQSATPTDIRARDLRWQICCSGGPGGQHVNKTASAVILTHLPSGTQIRADRHREQGRNRSDAMERLRALLSHHAQTNSHMATNAQRCAQVGSGERSDKIRTIRMQDGQVVDHRNGSRIPLRCFLAGELEGLLDG
jgi:peptide chain release factor 1